MADMDTYDGEPRVYEDDRDYGRERSRSPVDRDGDTRIRDEPANGRGNREHAPKPASSEDASNSGSNLFVTGIHPKLSEDEISRLFEKYGVVQKCNIMRDPHSRESRGFGFVDMMTAEEADAAKEGLQGEVFEGRTLSIEKARRARPRTPTPGKYFGPPKRDDRPPRGGFRDRYDDRGYGRRDDRPRGGYRDRGDRYGDRYDDRYEDRGYGGGRRRDDYPPSDRYSSRDDRYGDRRGGGYGGYDRAPRAAPIDAAPPSYGGAPRDAPPPPRDYDDRRRYD